MTGSAPMAPLDREAREMALDVLADALEWRLTRGSWEAVGQGLEAMLRAVAAGDASGLMHAAADVETAGPYRIAGLEDAGLLPLPEEYRERVGEMVHVLGAAPAEARAAGPGDAGAGTAGGGPGADGSADRAAGPAAAGPGAGTHARQ